MEFNLKQEAINNSDVYDYAQKGMDWLGYTKYNRQWVDEYVQNHMSTFVGTLTECNAELARIRGVAEKLKRDNNIAYVDRWNDFYKVWFDTRAEEIYGLSEIEKKFAERLKNRGYCDTLEGAMEAVGDFADLLKEVK